MPLRIDPSRVPELVQFDYVLGDDLLLDGVRVLAEASVVDAFEDGAEESSYWSVEERLAPVGITSAVDIRDTLSDELRRVAELGELSLALTSGKDSRLVADTLHALGATPTTFTMGAGTPDDIGARAVAEAFGWPHSSMQAAAWRPDWDRAVRMSAWTEGLQLARDLLNVPPQWPVPEGAVMVWGSGGETGRAFYWASASGPDAARRFCTPSPLFSRAAADNFVARASDLYNDALSKSGSDPLRALDLLYARGRMRKWLGRNLPIRAARGAITAYTSPRLTQVLLDLPEDQRRDGSAFLAALNMGRLPPQTPIRLSRRELVTSRVQRAWRTRRPHPTIARTLAAKGGGPERVIEILGRRWWERSMLDARRTEGAALTIWNALSVEALAELLEQL